MDRLGRLVGTMTVGKVNEARRQARGLWMTASTAAFLVASMGARAVVLMEAQLVIQQAEAVAAAETSGTKVQKLEERKL